MDGKIKPKPGKPGRRKGGNLLPDDGKPNTNKEKERKAMKKDDQIVVNEKCMEEYKKAMEEFHNGVVNERRLRSCSAWVYETANYWILRSYNTVIAVTSKGTGVCYDVLRIVYGYTATSAQHITKFTHDYHTKDYKWSAPKWMAR